MSDELKPCPNRMCRNDRVGTASRALDACGLSQAFGECPMCGTRGPMVAGATMVDAEAKAREAWNDLPRGDEFRNEMANVLASAMEAMGDAAQDLAEWRQLGRRWREESDDYDFDPKCPTDAGMERTEIVLKRIAVARLAIRRFRERRAVDMQVIDPDAEDRPTLREEAAAVLVQLDELAAIWGDEGVFRRCRDRLRAALERSDA